MIWIWLWSVWIVLLLRLLRLLPLRCGRLAHRLLVQRLLVAGLLLLQRGPWLLGCAIAAAGTRLAGRCRPPWRQRGAGRHLAWRPVELVSDRATARQRR